MSGAACPKCGHGIHGAVCLNIASDGDCACTYATSAAREAIAEALFISMSGGSSGLDEMLEGICYSNADTALVALAEAGIQVLDQGTIGLSARMAAIEAGDVQHSLTVTDLRRVAEGWGFVVKTGRFTLKDGQPSGFWLQPEDPRLILKAVAVALEEVYKEVR